MNQQRKLPSLPLGIQSFKEIRERKAIYVDKTGFITRWREEGKYYFLSRPRRFGKSLLVSTMAAFFSGRRELFVGLSGESSVPSSPYPVIELLFNRLAERSFGLREALCIELSHIAQSHGISLLMPKAPILWLRELIEALSRKYQQPVVVLVDEYDKPIVDYLSDPARAEANREELRDFFSVMKGLDEFVHFFFVTGVSKFARTSLFSDLNHLVDLTLSPLAAQVCGYSEDEVKKNFEVHLINSVEATGIPITRLQELLKTWYDGYSWDGQHFVYNPFSLMSFFQVHRFDNFWYDTGTPNFFMQLYKVDRLAKYERKKVASHIFNTRDLRRVPPTTLLFQAGYLSVKSIEVFGQYTISYPNLEVRNSLIDEALIQEHERERVVAVAARLAAALEKLEFDKFIDILSTFLSSIPITLKKRLPESLYSTILYTLFSSVGLYAKAEVFSGEGIADLVVSLPSATVIIECKLDVSADQAIKQIEVKEYGASFEGSVYGIGLSFSSSALKIKEWKVKEIKGIKQL